MELFAKFDANDDGLLTSDEVPDRLWQILSTGDTDEDGGISLEELTAIALEHHRRDPFSGFDANEDGALTVDEVPEGIWGHISQADANSDGAVTMEELASFVPERGGAGHTEHGHPARGLHERREGHHRR